MTIKDGQCGAGEITYEIENEEGEFCAGSSNLLDAQHYALVFGQDRPVRLIEVAKRELPLRSPTDAQEGLSGADEVVAFLVECPVKPVLEFADASVPDAATPLVRQSALTACQQEVERLRNERDYAWEKMQNAEAYCRIETTNAENAEARILELRRALEPFVRHLNEMKFDLDHEGNELPGGQECGYVYLTLADFRAARAAFGGQSNG